MHAQDEEDAKNTANASVEKRLEACQLLKILTKFLLTVGLVLVAFGPNYSFIFFDLLYGMLPPFCAWTRHVVGRGCLCDIPHLLAPIN
jgi:hypothetical protein